MSVLSTWKAHVASRTKLVAHAKAAHAKAQAKLQAARAAGTHPRAALVKVRDAASVNLAKRRAQLAAAKRVVARHTVVAAYTVSANGAAFIGRFEGFRSAPYRDAVGVWTIGYGHTAGVGPGSHPLTNAQALALLRTDLNTKYGAATAASLKAVGFRPTQREFDALVSFAYNLGTGVISDASTTMGSAVRSKDRARIAAAFLPYDKAGGSVLAGLSTRRHAESKLFLGGSY